MRRRNSRTEPTGQRIDVWHGFIPLNQWTDERLVEAAQAGNQEAFAELVRRYQSKIYNLALRYTNDSETAMDITQDAFVKAWQTLPKFRGEANFYTWIYRIAMNLCIDRHRRALVRGEPQKVSLEELIVERQRFEETEDESELWWEEAETAEPEAEVLRQEMRQKVWEAVQQLPALLKQVILLREYEGLSLQEIAKITGTNVGTVKSRLYQARQHLKKLLAPYFNS
ncbi:MAG: sigma-70 family RNA polymerase sigma factor [Armatimonadetes bacterium]|nr:sigma-70 family RNA polymerase sigma factor [Armatimonadota bacterium]MDW8028088.1 sigma-70 family RNA polymerase sigma factor [Armatimonadota bacterium]